MEAGRVVAEMAGGTTWKVESWWVEAESWRVKAGRAEVVREGWGAVHIAAPYRLSAQAAHVPYP